MADTLTIYRGVDSPEDIDWDTPVGSRSGTGAVTIADQEYTPGRTYYYGVRQTSGESGLEEKNISRVVEVAIGADGEVVGERPDRVSQVEAQAAAGGKIEVRWRHGIISGTTPVTFNVYYDQGQGAENIDITDAGYLAGTVSYRGETGYLFTSDALTGGAEYAFQVTAEDADGAESGLSAAARARADSTIPAAIAGVTGATRL